MKESVSSDTRLLDPRLLRLLDALFATGSVTKASEMLGQSQPTVSMWLSRLRKNLDDPLFVRTAEGMLPTPRAEAVIGTARQALELPAAIVGDAERFRPGDIAAAVLSVHDRREPCHFAARASSAMFATRRPAFASRSCR